MSTFEGVWNRLQVITIKLLEIVYRRHGAVQIYDGRVHRIGPDGETGQTACIYELAVSPLT